MCSSDLDFNTVSIPISTILRWFLYDSDIVDNINDLAEALGLSRVSEEGDDKEREESDVRIEKLEPLVPFIDLISDAAASSMAAYHMAEMLNVGEIDESDEDALLKNEMMINLYKAVAFAAIVGALSIGFELGILDTVKIGRAHV